MHVDMLRSEMTTRISFRLHGQLAQDEITPATDVSLVLNAISGPQEFIFKKGQRINRIEAVFPMDGNPSLYPFDRYEGVMWLFATLPSKQKHSPRSVVQPSPNIIPNELALSPELPVITSLLAQETHADTRTTFSALIPGFTFRESKSIQSAAALKGLTGIAVHLNRSRQVVLISIVAMAMMAGLSGGLVVMVLNVVSGGRRIENFQVAMSTSFIFGLPALRNIQPGVPPPGTFGDTIVFTWAEMIAAASAVALIVHWLFLRSRATTQAPTSSST